MRGTCNAFTVLQALKPATKAKSPVHAQHSSHVFFRPKSFSFQNSALATRNCSCNHSPPGVGCCCRYAGAQHTTVCTSFWRRRSCLHTVKKKSTKRPKGVVRLFFGGQRWALERVRRRRPSGCILTSASERVEHTPPCHALWRSGYVGRGYVGRAGSQLKMATLCFTNDNENVRMQLDCIQSATYRWRRRQRDGVLLLVRVDRHQQAAAIRSLELHENDVGRCGAGALPVRLSACNW